MEDLRGLPQACFSPLAAASKELCGSSSDSPLLVLHTSPRAAKTSVQTAEAPQNCHVQTHLCVDPEALCPEEGSSGPGTWPRHPQSWEGRSETLSVRQKEELALFCFCIFGHTLVFRHFETGPCLAVKL